MAPVEFICLLQLAVVAIVMALIPAVGKIQTWGIIRFVGHPTPGDAALPAWVLRAERAHLNLMENMIPFAVIVAGTMFGVSDEITQLGAEVFVVPHLRHSLDSHDRLLRRHWGRGGDACANRRAGSAAIVGSVPGLDPPARCVAFRPVPTRQDLG